MEMRNILITGGAGFIGANLALELVKRGYRVRVLDALTPQIHGENPEEDSPLYQSIKGKVDFIKGTVTSRSDWERAIEGVDCIVHLAAETGTGQSMYEIEKYVTANIGGTAIMLDILANQKHNVKRVVIAESRAIYGEGQYYSEELGKVVCPGPRAEADMLDGDFEVKYPGCNETLRLVATDENCEIHPTSIYGLTKQVQGQMAHMICPAIGIDCVTLRYQNVYGPGQSLQNPYTGILAIFSTLIRKVKKINIFEDGQESRDFVYIDDVVDATIRAIEVPEARGHAFNIGTGVSTTVTEVVETLMEKFGRQVPIEVSGNFRIGDIRHNYADISKARAILGFEPKWDFPSGIAKFVSWAKTQSEGTDAYEASLEEMRQKGLYK
ncbi:MAG: NAD-dependent epimerase/dehydratase family protein [Bacteroidales bacterium]|nr:NAD-dependent epimerase/dehydratase family protein [Bacteroidales bacterium]